MVHHSQIKRRKEVSTHSLISEVVEHVVLALLSGVEENGAGDDVIADDLSELEVGAEKLLGLKKMPK